jgi:membrane protease YdiL (CAAX protease family)
LPAEFEPSGKKRLAPWVDCMLYMLVGWLAIFTSSILVFAALRSFRFSGNLEPYLNLLPNLAGISLVLAIGLSRSRETPRRVLALRAPRLATLPAVALSTVGLALLASELDTYMEEILPPPEWIVEMYRRVLEYHTFWEFVGVAMFLVIMAPLTEELMFRGLFLHRLWEGYGPQRAVVGSSICFGVFHLLPWQAVGAGLVGIYLGWLLVRTRSIFVPMFSHALFNLIPVASAGLASRSAILQRLSAGDASASHLPPAWLALAALGFAVGWVATRRATALGSAPDS